MTMKIDDLSDLYKDLGNLKDEITKIRVNTETQLVYIKDKVVKRMEFIADLISILREEPNDKH